MKPPNQHNGHDRYEILPGELFEQACSLLQGAGGEVLNANVRSVGHHFQRDPNYKSQCAVAHGQGVEDVRMGLLRHLQQVAGGSDELVGGGQPVKEAVLVGGGLRKSQEEIQTIQEENFYSKIIVTNLWKRPCL